MEQIRQLQEANDKLKQDMDLFAMPEALPQRPDYVPEAGSLQGTSAPKSSFSADVLGMEMPYLGEAKRASGSSTLTRLRREGQMEAMRVGRPRG